MTFSYNIQLFYFQYLTLTFDMPWLPLVNDFKQGLFYASLMVFWLVFAGEHLLNDDGTGNTLATYSLIHSPRMANNVSNLQSIIFS